MGCDRGDCGLFTAVGGLCPVRPEGVDATGHGRGGLPGRHRNAWAARTHNPVAHAQPWEPRRTRLRAGDHSRGDGP
jgi:hypothetical protein